MLLPGTRVYHLCSDVIPISSWKKAEAKVLKCKSPPKPWYKPWQKPKETCKMSTLSRQRGEPDVDLSSDLMPEAKTTLVLEREKNSKPKAKKEEKTTTKD